MDIKSLAYDCLYIARDIAPKRTGNLAFNAIQLQMLNNGFSIIYYTYVAPYVIDLQEKSKKHKGFIDRTSTAITAYTTGAINGHKNNLNATKERVSKLAPNNPARKKVLQDSIKSSVDWR
jgi:hypothetical protein